jgi:hypothetical protein
MNIKKRSEDSAQNLQKPQGKGVFISIAAVPSLAEGAGAHALL